MANCRTTVADRGVTSTEEWIPAPCQEEVYVRLDGTSLDVKAASVPIVHEGRKALPCISGHHQTEGPIAICHSMCRQIREGENGFENVDWSRKQC